MKTAIAAAILISSSAGMAQGVVSLPNVDKDIWTVVPTDKGAALVHKTSGGICDSSFRDLTLTAIKDYVPDGTNSSCQYEKRDASGMTRMTLYFYTHPQITGVGEFNGAKKAILGYNKHAGVKVTLDDAETTKCFNAMAPQLGEALLARAREADPKATAKDIQVGAAMYDFDFAKTDKAPARAEKSLLTVYQTGGWIMKARVTSPAGDDSSLNSCRYAALANIAEAKVLGGKPAAAK